MTGIILYVYPLGCLFFIIIKSPEWHRVSPVANDELVTVDGDGVHEGCERGTCCGLDTGAYCREWGAPTYDET